MRPVVSLEPDEFAVADPSERLRKALRGMGEVFDPGDAETPILAPNARAAVFSWLAELRAADEIVAAGLRPRSTALLYGPPGCGKTTLAHHLAARLGYPMLLIGAEDIMAKYLGESEQRIATLFRGLEAAEVPCLVFIDELEAIGGKRDLNRGGGADNARTSMLTVLLRRLERYHGLLCAATNRQQDIDPALWRRFHLQLEVDLPGAEERFAILRRYGLPWAFPDEDLDLLAALTDGASPALLRGLMEGVKRRLVLAPAHGLERVGGDGGVPGGGRQLGAPAGDRAAAAMGRRWLEAGPDDVATETRRRGVSNAAIGRDVRAALTHFMVRVLDPVARMLWVTLVAEQDDLVSEGVLRGGSKQSFCRLFPGGFCLTKTRF